jgi:hypothetical protein
VGITVFVAVYLAFFGANYYQTALEQRFFHEQNELLKPSGLIGHGFGIIGSLLIVVGVFGYMARKRFRRFSRWGYLKYWLEFHIFLCSLGPVLVLYHTAFKFGGIVAVSFWSMVAVVVSGLVGRFIYLQIPRTLEGRDLSLNELNLQKAAFFDSIKDKFALDNAFVDFLNKVFVSEKALYQGSFFSKMAQRLRYERIIRKQIAKELKVRQIQDKDLKRIKKLVHSEIVLNRRIAWLSTMHRFLEYWHVIHLPFALIMLVIMIVHVGVALVFGYTWVF